MAQAAMGLDPLPDLVLVDAVKGLKLPMAQKAIIKGDLHSYLIGAASIVAKEARDRMMKEYDKLYPGYGFARNMGYGTAEHVAALKAMGPCPIHRASFLTKILGGNP
jgi:ribonuclease HII